VVSRFLAHNRRFLHIAVIIANKPFNDPHSFVQQFRGYLDHVEGESRNAAKENAQLRQGLEMDAIAIEAITSQLQIATKRADHAERELKTALKNNKEMVLALQGLRTIAKLLEAASTEKGRQLDKLQSRINDLDKNITGLNSLINEYTERAWEAEDRLKVAEVEVDSLRSKLREEEAETASAKKELEELRAVQKDLSALFQKGNYMLQGKRKQVIDREK
jgi:chromosome segregation ATPase